MVVCFCYDSSLALLDLGEKLYLEYFCSYIVTIFMHLLIFCLLLSYICGVPYSLHYTQKLHVTQIGFFFLKQMGHLELCDSVEEHCGWKDICELISVQALLGNMEHYPLWFLLNCSVRVLHILLVDIGSRNSSLELRLDGICHHLNTVTIIDAWVLLGKGLPPWWVLTFPNFANTSYLTSLLSLSFALRTSPKQLLLSVHSKIQSFVLV